MDSPSHRRAGFTARWKRLYLYLAVFTGIAVLSSMTLVHWNLVRFEDLIFRTQTSLARVEQLARISDLANAANAPGNDVFETANVKIEREKFEKINEELKLEIKKFVFDYKNSSTHGPVYENESLTKSHAQFEKTARSVFEAFDKKNFKVAGKNMAAMDRAYSDFNNRVSSLRSYFENYSQNELGIFGGKLRLSRNIEILVGILVVLSLVGLTLYGNRLFRYFREQRLTETKFIDQLAQKNREMDQIMKAISDSAIVSVTDANGKITSANSMFSKVSEFSEEELIGNDHRIVNSGAHPKEFFKRMWDTIKSGKVWTGLIQNKTKSGKAYYVQTVISPVGRDLSKPEKFISIRFDATEQIRTELQLKEAQRVAKIGSWSWDKQTGRIEWSSQMYEIFPEDPMSGPPSFDRHYSTIHPEDQEVWKSTVTSAVENRTGYRMRFRSVFPNRLVWVEAVGQPLVDSKGNVTGLHGTCQDVTALVVKEEEVQVERQKAAHSAKLASLGEMSAGVAHEINNPLAVISGNLSLLPKFQNDTEKFNNKIETMKKSVERISKIVNGLRKFSRTSDNTVSEVMSLEHLFSEVGILVEARSKRKSVPVEFSLKTSRLVFFNVVELEQVLVNLVNNGIDAVANLPEKWVRVEAIDRKEKVVIQVTDSGPGISEEVERKLFQPFFTTKNVGEGTGLGLSISKGILEANGATISLDKICANTRFIIELPAVDPVSVKLAS